MKVYDSLKIAIRLAFFGFMLVAIGFLIKNESVNIFYTFKNTFILLFAEGSLKLGTAIIANLPLIIMLNMCCKRANSGYPVILAIVGYLSYLISTMLFAPTTLSSTAYNTGLGINSMLNTTMSTKYPLETGMIGSFIVAYITRFSYVRSRHQSSFSILAFLNKDSSGIIYNVVFCSLAGIGVAYVYPFAFDYLQELITYISKDLMDPLRMAVYGISDRVLSMLSLSNIIRQPFWYSALGGSLQTKSGQSIIGDINIFAYIKNTVTTYAGAGRFVTAYYVINMFMVPAIYIGGLISMSDTSERNRLVIPCIGLCGLSVVCGNPLPIELVMLFTSPLLLVIYLLLVGGVFYYLNYASIYLGSNIISGSTVTAMPGNFPDFIINIRNATYAPVLSKILLVGVVAFLLMFAFTVLYFHFFAYDITRAGKAKAFAKEVINACGGYDNISYAGSGLFKICIHLKDQEKINYDLFNDMNLRKITETKDGVDIDCGSSAYIIANRITYLCMLKVAK